MRKIEVSPSILAANFANLGAEVKKIESIADYIHIDVMDGHFVPNLTFGSIVAKAVKRITTLPLDSHLMIDNPESFVDEFCKISEIVSVHYESTHHLHRLIQRIKEKDVKAFVALNPHTSVELLQDILMDVDGVLIMSVNPGFGGQKFIPNTLNKIRRLNDIKRKTGLTFKIEVDGGINEETFESTLNAGVDILVAGSYIFGSEDPIKAINTLKGQPKKISEG